MLSKLRVSQKTRPLHGLVLYKQCSVYEGVPGCWCAELTWGQWEEGRMVTGSLYLRAANMAGTAGSWLLSSVKTEANIQVQELLCEWSIVALLDRTEYRQAGDISSDFLGRLKAHWASHFVRGVSWAWIFTSTSGANFDWWEKIHMQRTLLLYKQFLASA